MPNLDFKGKSFIYTHHLGVPYRELLVDAAKSCAAVGKQPGLDDNLIIHGDNLEALKALLPRFAGKVDCIYIDPPYNTGTEGWCYNDAVNAPLMREWLKKAANPVERDDLQRHDKWLCMMWPRLQLLKELLAEDGAIFVSIDDNEVHHLRDIMDEIFGEESFVGNFLWKKKATSTNVEGATVSEQTDYTICYGKNPNTKVKPRVRAKETRTYPHKDQEGSYRVAIIEKKDKGTYKRDTMKFEIIGKKPRPGKRWQIGEKLARNLETKGRFLEENEIVKLKIYDFEDKDTTSAQPLLLENYGSSDSAAKDLTAIFGEEELFDNPKPQELIAHLVSLVTQADSLILDSFAGSGTTAHAVLALNAKDGGKRRFILCETEDYADTLTAERVRRVISGYDFTGTQQTELHPPEKVTWMTFARDAKRNEILDRIESIKTLEGANYEKIETKIEDGVLTVVGKKTVKERMPGLGGSFTYVELGEPMDLERLLAETPGSLPAFANLARYLFHTATGRTLLECANGAPSDAPQLIGEMKEFRIYLHYRPEEAWLRSPAAAFKRTQAEAIAAGTDGKQTLVFAASKYVTHRTLRELRVDFAQLPYALHRVQSA